MADQLASKFHQIPDALWERIDLMLPIYNRSCKGGRPRLPMRKRGERHLVCALDRLSMEGDAQPVRVGQRDSCLLSRVGGAGRIRRAVAVGPRRVRRATRNRLEVAERGRGDDQIATGWGKKPGKTRPIEASWASSDRCSSTVVACRWRRPWMAPMCMTKSCWPRRSMALPLCGPKLSPTGRSICAWTKDTPASRSNRKSAGVDTFRTCRPRVPRLPRSIVVMARLAAGKSNAHILG